MRGVIFCEMREQELAYEIQGWAIGAAGGVN